MLHSGWRHGPRHRFGGSGVPQGPNAIRCNIYFDPNVRHWCERSRQRLARRSPILGPAWKSMVAHLCCLNDNCNPGRVCNRRGSRVPVCPLPADRPEPGKPQSVRAQSGPWPATTSAKIYSSRNRRRDRQRRWSWARLCDRIGTLVVRWTGSSPIEDSTGCANLVHPTLSATT